MRYQLLAARLKRRISAWSSKVARLPPRRWQNTWPASQDSCVHAGEMEVATMAARRAGEPVGQD